MRRSPLLATALLATLLAGSPAASVRTPSPCTAPRTAHSAPRTEGVELTSHVRALNAAARDLLATAIARSTIIKNLVDALEATDVVVYVTVEPLPDHRTAGYLSFHSRAGGFRYVMVRLDSLVPPRDLTVMLGHELQHALEVAAAPEVHDPTTLALLYTRIGWSCGPNKWETDAARSVGERVLGELRGFRPSNLHPLPIPR